MPKLRGPLLSLDAHGNLAKAITFQRRPGGAAVYGYKKPKVPLTARQIEQRLKIYWCVSAWQQLTDEQKAVWEGKAEGRHQSGYSYFMQYHRGYFLEPDCALYTPLYDVRLQSSPFLSLDPHEHHCTVLGAVATTLGYLFDGSNDRIYVPDASSIDFGTSDFSVDLWAKVIPHASLVRGLLGKTDGYLANWAVKGYGLYYSASTLFFHFNDGGNDTGVRLDHPVNLDDGKYHRIVGVADRDDLMLLYIDGELVASKDCTSTQGSVSNSSRLYLGYCQAIGGHINYHSGNIGLAKLLRRIKTLAEVQHDYQATNWRY